MITVDDLSLQYSGAPLFSKVNLQFTPGNCYGIIGANGAGKSTFLKILSGQLEPSTGSVYIDPKARMSVLKQDQTMYDAYTVMDTVIMGNQRLYDCGKEKDAIYAKDEMTDEDGIRASELEEEFADLGGWEAESDASRILQGLGVAPEHHETMMSDTGSAPEGESPAGAGALRPPGHYPARRADQQSRPCERRLAGRFPDGLRRHGASSCQPRPLFPQ